MVPLAKLIAEVIFLLDNMDWTPVCSAIAHTIDATFAILSEIMHVLASVTHLLPGPASGPPLP